MDTLQGPSAHAWQLNEPGQGKMFGVLVVAGPDGALGYLRAFSGMLHGQWEWPGWAPPTFDAAQRDLVWIPGEAEMRGVAAERADPVVPVVDGDHEDIGPAGLSGGG